MTRTWNGEDEPVTPDPLKRYQDAMVAVWLVVLVLACAALVALGG